jgi:hypothetical protein
VPARRWQRPLAIRPEGEETVAKPVYEHSQTKYVRENEEARSDNATGSERRIVDRHLFTAAAEVVELKSGERFSTRTTDLSPGGCFVDTMLPFQADSKVHVIIRNQKARFEANGSVIYSQSGLGMGIAFDALDFEQRITLDAWLAASKSPQPPHEEAASAGETKPALAARSNHLVVIRLVQLMVRKGILSQAEGATILNDSVLF